MERLIKQTHRKSQETLEIRLEKSERIFDFNPPISIEASWMIGLTSLEVYNTFFNINTTNNKFELCTDTFVEFSITELKDELEEFLEISKIPPNIYKII